MTELDTGELEDAHESRAYRSFLRATRAKTWSCGVPVDNEIVMGVIFYLLIVGMIVLGTAVRYRFNYGNF